MGRRGRVMDDPLITREQVAERVGNITAHQVKLAARRKEIAVVRIGTRYLFRAADVDAWIESRRTPAATTTVNAKPTKLAAARRSRAAS